jgi:hypothetical protein
MTKRPARVPQAEIDRAIRAVKKAGATSFDIVIEEARIRLSAMSSRLHVELQAFRARRTACGR